MFYPSPLDQVAVTSPNYLPTMLSESDLSNLKETVRSEVEELNRHMVSLKRVLELTGEGNVGDINNKRVRLDGDSAVEDRSALEQFCTVAELPDSQRDDEEEVVDADGKRREEVDSDGAKVEGYIYMDVQLLNLFATQKFICGKCKKGSIKLDGLSSLGGFVFRCH
jgi:hypothetical protein